MEWGGVGLLPFLPCKKKGGPRIEGGVRDRRISNSSLNSGDSSSIASTAWAVGMFKLRAKNNVHHQKESEVAKNNNKNVL